MANEHSAFRVMCLMWGKETALKKCREFGISVTEEELREQEEQEEKYKSMNAAIMSMLKKNGGDHGAR